VIATGATSCNVTLPSITANTGCTSVGWNTISGATTGTGAGEQYQLTNDITLYANAANCNVGNGGGGGTTSNNPTPTNPTTNKCYLVNHKYVWTDTAPNGGVEQSGKTEALCTGCDDDYMLNSSNACVKKTTTTPTEETNKCYVVNHKYIWSSTKPNGGSEVSKTEALCTGCEDGYTLSDNSCVVPTTSAPPTSKPQDVETGPKTGTTAIIFAWIAGLTAIGYSFWYFKRAASIDEIN
jgi:hypothetical protein